MAEKFYYEFIAGKSSKFWEIEIKGNIFITRYGRIGTKGREIIKEWESLEIAQDEATKLRLSKEKKGYILKEKNGQKTSKPIEPIKKGIISGYLEYIELDKKAEVPILDYVKIADVYYLVDDRGVQVLNKILQNKELQPDHYVIKMKDNQGGLLYMVFGIAGNDSGGDWKAEGQTITIDSRERTGKLGHESNTLGIVTFNEKALDNGWAQLPSFLSGNTLKDPDRKLGKATKFNMKEYNYGNMEFWFDGPHEILQSWTYNYELYVEGKGYVNWNITQIGKKIILHGAKREEKVFDSVEEAAKAVKLFREEKEKEGYEEEY